MGEFWFEVLKTLLLPAFLVWLLPRADPEGWQAFLERRRSYVQIHPAVFWTVSLFLALLCLASTLVAHLS